MSDRADAWTNAIAYQAVWFAAVIGAGRGLWWPGVAAAALFVAAQLGVSRERGIDLKLMLAALACGLAIEGALATSGLARHAAAAPALPGGAPLWLLAIWVSFALTLRRSLRFLIDRPLATLAFGAIGGPLAYLGAARGWQAIDFAAPLWQPLVALGIGWSLALPALMRLATRLHPRRPLPAPLATRGHTP
jgi:hypothetical protein